MRDKKVIGAIEKLSPLLLVLSEVAKEKPFGIVHESAPVLYMGHVGTIVWDYLLWNELTFVDDLTQKKTSICARLSDKEIEIKFREFVAKYGTT